MKQHRLDDLFCEGFEGKFDKIAVIFDDAIATARKITYAEVLENAEKIGAILKKLHSYDQIIGCSSVPDLLTPSLILGILKIPAAFCFLDPRLPHHLIVKILKSCGIGFIVDLCPQKFKVYGNVVAELTLDIGKVFVIEVPGICKRRDYFPDWRLAYVVHTSGTTGTPKTIRVPHRCIIPNVVDLTQWYNMSCKDVIFIASPFTFDPSIVDLFLAFSSGASVLLVPEILRASPSKLVDTLTNRHSVTYMQATPTLMHSFTPLRLRTSLLSETSSLRILCLGGEKCPQTNILASWKHPENRTDLYNIYGISEVSSWATINAIPNSDLKGDCGEVSLGSSLSHTVLEVIDENGDVVDSGEGELYIGGAERTCLISWDDYDIIPKGPMRPSGDWVRISTNGEMYYLGRKDDQIKRFGKKFHLKVVEKCLLQSLPLQNAAVVWRDNKSLIAFIKADGSQSEIRSDDIIRILKDRLPSHMVPDDIISVQEFPMTPHGKLDIRKMLAIKDVEKLNCLGGIDEILIYITKLWEDTILTCSSNDANFLTSGGDSVKGVQFCEQAECKAGCALPHLLDILLNKSFSDVCSYIYQTVTASEPLSRNDSMEISNQSSVTDPEEILKLEETCRHIQIYNRGGGIRVCSCDVARSAKDLAILIQTDPIIKLEWKCDMEKCIDASPLVIYGEKHGVAYIGSHSHKFAAVSIESGQKIWEIVVGDRIESSACASTCGNFIYFGCYDHKLYCVKSQSGDLVWTYCTDEVIKCSPVFCTKEKSVIFGSHDHNIYSLAYKDGACLWKINLHSGSILSTPYIHEEADTLYVASLGGKITSLSLKNGEMHWSANVSKPIFSSPAPIQNGFCVGCVDGNLYAFRHTGEIMWNYRCGGPIFSSPCTCTPNLGNGPSVIVFGSHDHHVYCVEEVSGTLIWKFSSTSPIYSTAYPCIAVYNKDSYVFTCSTDGHLYLLSLVTGKLLAKYVFGGEVFSSPIVVNDKILVGCRDNNLYCLSLCN